MNPLIRSGLAIAAIAAVTMTAAAPASADTLTFTGASWQNTQAVSVLSPNGPGGTSPTNVGAGRLALTGVLIDGVPPAVNMNAWCIDLQHWFGSPGSYDLGNAPPAIENQLEALLVGALNSSLDLTSSGNFNAAALQVAIWKTVYDPTYTMSLAGNGATINTLADSFITNAQNPLNTVWKASSLYHIATLTAAIQPNQELIALLPGPGNANNVPEPASLALLSVGLIALGAARRRKGRTLN